MVHVLTQYHTRWSCINLTGVVAVPNNMVVYYFAWLWYRTSRSCITRRSHGTELDGRVLPGVVAVPNKMVVYYQAWLGYRTRWCMVRIPHWLVAYYQAWSRYRARWSCVTRCSRRAATWRRPWPARRRRSSPRRACAWAGAASRAARAGPRSTPAGNKIMSSRSITNLYRYHPKWMLICTVVSKCSKGDVYVQQWTSKDW